MLVEDVVGVDHRRPVLVDLVLQAAAPDRVTRLDELEGVAGRDPGSSGIVVFRDRAAARVAALCSHASTDFPLVQLTRQAVGAPQLEQVLGRDGGVDVA
ncbi:hypothetical protein D3C84_821150 [compost metagenome]